MMANELHVVLEVNVVHGCFLSKLQDNSGVSGGHFSLPGSPSTSILINYSSLLSKGESPYHHYTYLTFVSP